MTPSPETMVDLLEQTAEQHGACEAFVHDRERITFAELHRAVGGVARLFADRGLTKGDVVSLCLPSSIDFAIAYHAAMRIGAISSALNPRLGAEEMAAITDRTRPVLAVTEAGGPGSLSLAELRAGRSLPEQLRSAVRVDDIVAVVWTSGTTGLPKGAMYDHRTLQAMAATMGDLSRPRDRRLSSVPFAHVGFMGRVWDTVGNGICEVIVSTPWRAAEALALVEAEQVTVSQGVPTQWELMLASPVLDDLDTSTVRVAAVGGAPATAALVRRIRDRFGCPVLSGYASTETGTISRSSASDPAEVAERTVGRPARGVEVELVDEQSEAVSDGAVGRIRCRSSATMIGYWEDPEATSAAVDGQGWVHTGDLGRFEDGNLVVVGRTKDMYIRGGYNVYPGQVEAVLVEHPKVAQVAVVGTADAVMGEVGVAFVVLVPGASAGTAAGLRAWACTRMADYKAPDAVVVVGDLPVNAVGKIDKGVLHPLAEAAMVERIRARS